MTTLSSLIHGFIGVILIIGICVVLSPNRKLINWYTVVTSLILQIFLAFLVLYSEPFQLIIESMGKAFVAFLAFSRQGSDFLFGSLVNPDQYGFIFVFQVLPTIIFFSALTSLLFYFGIMQPIVGILAWFMSKGLKISGFEGIVSISNIFLGQTEAPLLIKPYLPNLSRSELFLVMTSGMATIAGGVMAAYIGFLGGTDPIEKILFAKHLITASVMAAPGAVAISKIILPQKEPIQKIISVEKNQMGNNFFDTISNGTIQGVKLCINIAAMLLVFISLIALLNYLLGMIGNWTQIDDWINHTSGGKYNKLSLEFVIGIIFSPLAWACGVNWADSSLVGQLIGQKLIFTEFVGFVNLASMKESHLFTDPRSVIMATYMLCGFANFASIGVIIGGLGTLAPARKPEIASIALLSMVAGMLTSLLSATIIGAMI